MKTFQPKLLVAMKGYTGKQFVNDLIAGLVVAIIALPLSIALALASGANPQEGLYTAIVAGFFIALLGGSRVNISGPTAAFATIVAGIIAGKHGMTGLIIATIMAGFILIIMGLCRAGTLIKYIPVTVTTGFTSGIAVTILIGQIKDFLGLQFLGGEKPVEAMEKLIEIGKYIGTINWWALLVGVVGLAVLIVWPFINKRIPGSLLAVGVGVGLMFLLKAFGVEIPTIQMDGNIGFRFAFPLENFTWGMIPELIPSAFTIALLAGVESLLSCVVSDEMIQDKHNSNTELIAQGVGNIFVGLVGGIPATGAIARTAANVKNGGRTPIAGMVHALVLLVVFLFLMPYAAYIPMSIIAAILFMVAYNMCEWRHFVKICKTARWNDVLVLVLTFVLTIVFNLVVAIIVGMVLHLIFLLIRRIREKRAANKA